MKEIERDRGTETETRDKRERERERERDRARERVSERERERERTTWCGFGVRSTAWWYGLNFSRQPNMAHVRQSRPEGQILALASR